MKKIVVIDDDLSMGMILKQTFSTQGYETDLAKDGEEGLAKVKIVQPDLIILDILMPGVNGLEVLDILKADPATKAIPVVIFTNLDDEKDAETALAKGALAYLSKSQYQPHQLMDTMKQFLL